MEKIRPIEDVCKDLKRAKDRLKNAKVDDENFSLFERVVYNRSHEYGSYVYEKHDCHIPMLITVNAWKKLESDSHIPVVIEYNRRKGCKIKLVDASNIDEFLKLGYATFDTKFIPKIRVIL